MTPVDPQAQMYTPPLQQQPPQPQQPQPQLQLCEEQQQQHQQQSQQQELPGHPTTHQMSVLSGATSNGPQAKTRQRKRHRSSTYVEKIARAMLSRGVTQMSLPEIYQAVAKDYKHVTDRPRWMGTIRHTVTDNKCFECVTPGKGAIYRINPSNLDDFLKGIFHSRRSNLRALRQKQRMTQAAQNGVNSNPPPSVNSHNFQN